MIWNIEWGEIIPSDNGLAAYLKIGSVTTSEPTKAALGWENFGEKIQPIGQ